MPTETSGELTHLIEPFRDPKFPFVHFIEDKMLVDDIFRRLNGGGIPWGLETGFGIEPTRSWVLDLSCSIWVAGEYDKRLFDSTIRDLSQRFCDINPMEFPPCKLILLPFAVHYSRCYPQTLVYRNYDYIANLHTLPPYKNLNPGQRLIVLVNGRHSEEYDLYIENLAFRGYNPNNLMIRSPSEIPISNPSYKNKYPEYILDVTKPLSVPST